MNSIPSDSTPRVFPHVGATFKFAAIKFAAIDCPFAIRRGANQ